jgi:hypothetical protein
VKPGWLDVVDREGRWRNGGGVVKGVECVRVRARSDMPDFGGRFLVFEQLKRLLSGGCCMGKEIGRKKKRIE